MATTNDLVGATCCVTGCREPATEYAAPNVPYCDRHAASNRAATAAMMDRSTAQGIAEGIASGDRLRAEHDGPAPHLTPHYGCPACPLGSGWVRDAAGAEWRSA